MRKFAVLGLFLAGCATPEAPHPLPREPGRQGTDKDRQEPLIDWSDGLSLAELIRSVERHGTAQAALFEVEAARARRAIAGTYPLNPEIEFQGAQGITGDSTTLGIGIRQVFELGGRVSRREAVADAGISRAGAEAEDALRELRGRARRAYWHALAAARRVDVARSSVELADKAVEVATARYEARQAAAIDVNLAKVGAGKARAAVRREEGEAEASRAEVAALCVERPPDGWKLSDRLPASRPEADLAKARDLALHSRPDLAALGIAGEESEARAALAEAEAAPDLGIGIGYEYGRDRIEGDGVDFRTSDHSVTLGLSLSLPLWNRRRGEVAEAEADRRRFAALHAALASEVSAEVVAAEARLRAASDTLTLYEKDILPAASKNLEDVRAAYASGEFAITELLRSQEDYQQILAESVEAEAAWAEALSALEDAVGRPLSEISR